MKPATVVHIAAMLGMLTLLPGCVGKLSKEFPERRMFVLDASRDSGTAKAANVFPGTATITPFTSSPGIGGRRFLYRVGEHEMEADFYNEYHSPSDEAVADATARWLDASGVFGGGVRFEGSEQSARWVLEGHIRSFYIDAREKREPVATLVMQFRLLDRESKPVPSEVVFSLEVLQQAPADSRKPEAFAAAGNLALQRALESLEASLSDRASRPLQ